MESEPTHPPLAGDAPNVHRELELKLHVPQASLERLWTHPLVVESAIGPRRVARLHNRYLDTVDRDLARGGMALRLRRIGRTWLQTLKTADESPGALSSRGEWETPVPGPALRWSALRATPLASLGSARSLARRLEPVFTTDFRRETRRLRLPDGSEVELALDVGTIHAGRGRTKRSLPIREVELELKATGSGDPAAELLRFARRLVRDVPMIPLAASKAARGYRLADGRVVEPARALLPAPRGGDRAPIHLGRVIDACTTALLDNVHALVGAGPIDVAEQVDPEFIHQARVALRRLRSALRTFRPIAKGRRFDEIDVALQELGHAFGGRRDLDVFAGTTMRRLDDKVGVDDAGRAAIAEVVAPVDARRVAAYASLRGHLADGAFGATALDLMRLANRLARDPSAGPALEACVPGWLDAQRRRIVRQSRLIAILDGDERHRLRVEIKRLRYALDLFGALFDPAAVDDFQGPLAELQTRLGRLNDEFVADRLLESFAPGPSRDLVRARYADWLSEHVRKQLPKIAALSVALELTPAPWSGEEPRRFG